MRKYTVTIPILRTSIEPRRKILEPAKEEWIAGAALDVFDQEPLSLHSRVLWTEGRQPLSGKEIDLKWIVNPQAFAEKSGNPKEVMSRK